MTNKYLEKIARKLSQKEKDERAMYVAKNHKGKLYTGFGMSIAGGASMGSGLADKMVFGGVGNKRLLGGAALATAGALTLRHIGKKVDKKFGKGEY